MRPLYSLVRPDNKFVHLEIDHAHPNVISAGSYGRIERLIPMLDEGTEEIIISDRKHITVHGSYNGMPVTLFNTGMTPGSADITLKEIIEACDEDEMNILRLGTAGSLRREIPNGSFVLSTEYTRWESTTDKILAEIKRQDPQFSPESYVARTDDALTHTLMEMALKYAVAGQKLYSGPTLVTDELGCTNKAIREGDIPEEEWNRNLAISMEGSVYSVLRDLYKVVQNRKIQVAELFTISDLVLQHDENESKHISLEQRELVETAQLRAGLDALWTMWNNKQS